MKVLARRDTNQPYNKENCYWREPQSETEARYGVEDIGVTEPETIPLTPEQQTQRDATPEEQKWMFDVWARMNWRARHYGPDGH
jgi:broad specificity polyphosphatase/5'/3'-nucleotidase SurE